MRHAEVTLDDKFLLEDGRVFITGVQALIRVLLDRKRLDVREGLNTAGFLSGYRGSPLGGLDQQAHRAGKLLAANDIVFKEGLNEDLAATAVWGTPAGQPVPRRQATMACSACGTARRPASTAPAMRSSTPTSPGPGPRAACVAVAGDDHACKSSTLPSQSEYAFQDFEMPVLAPADVQEVLDYGLLGYALSRFSGLWVGMIALADTMDCGVTIDVGLGRHQHRLPEGFQHARRRPRHPAQGPAARQGAAAAAVQAARRARLRPRQRDRPHGAAPARAAGSASPPTARPTGT